MKGFTKFAGGFTGVHNSSPSAATYNILLVGAGGGGGSDVGGGGGGGQVIFGTATFSGAGTITITVGAGGAVAATRYGMMGGNTSVSGNISVLAGTTAVGGSGGQGRTGGGTYAGGTGYNGGGGSYDYFTSTTYSGGYAGSSTTDGGASSRGCGGGGGSGGAGGTSTSTAGGNGGLGVASSVSGSVVRYGGGGGGAQYTGGSVGTGTDGGGNAGLGGVAGTTNRGGGGGGGQSSGSSTGGTGGSGVVILSYPSYLPNVLSYSGATFANSGGIKSYTFNTSGTIAFSAISSPTVISGLVGWYDMTQLTTTQWTDKSGSGNHATISGATATSVTAGNGSTLITNCLAGTTSHTIQWPAAILPATYTLFHVTRYTGGTNSRIYTGSSGNWLSGHWGGLSGQYYHEGWLTDSTTNYYSNNWFITTDQNSLARTNGITRSTSGGSASQRLSINLCPYGEQSTFQTVECIVYNRTLTLSECSDVELYLATKYGITLNT